MLNYLCYPTKRILIFKFSPMWFFDSVLEETPEKVLAKKKSEQDGSFLIIDDSVSVATLPDTAVQLFDTVMTEAEPTAEISFFSEPVVTPEVVSTEVSFAPESPLSPLDTLEEEGASHVDESSAEISFFSEPIIVPETETQTESVVATDNIFTLADETSAEVLDVTPETSGAVNNISFDVVMEEISKPEIVETIVLLDKSDIYTPLKKAIAEYDTILALHAKIAEAKDVEITDFNNQVALAKAGAKKALEERKALETEMDKVKQMRELFTAQLK